MAEKTLFNLKINITNLDDYFPHGTNFTGEYQAELYFEGEGIYQPILKIFFDDKEYLGDKIMRWNHDNDANLLDQFEFTKTITPDYLLDIDFSGYRVTGMTNGSGYYESNLKYFIIRLSGIKKVYSTTEENEPSVFYLNSPAFNLIELHYNYNIDFTWNTKPYKWEPENSIKKFISFGKIDFIPEHEFLRQTDNNAKQIEIKKKPRLKFNPCNLSEPEIKEHAALLCCLYSFYSQTRIDYTLSRIYTGGKVYVEIKKIKIKERSDPHGIFRWDFSQNPLKLINNVAPIHLLDNLEFITKLISRYNFALSTEGESKFMILYNILEQIRNKYILDSKIEQGKAGVPPNLKKVKEEYAFTTGKKKTDEIIKDSLKQIAEIVAQDDKELFLEEIPFKLTPIKVFSMANQFKSLFECIDIDPESFGIDFKKVKKLRDDIFHGRPVEDHKEILIELNRYKRLPRLVGIVMLKYFGIDDITTIKKQ